MGVFKKKKAPETKSPEGQMMDQIKAAEKMAPGIFDTYNKYGPQYAQLDMDIMKDIAPQYASLQQDIFNKFNPEAAYAYQSLGSALRGRGDLGSLAIQPDMKQAIEQDIRAGQYARGTATSPISAVTEAIRTLPARIQERDKYMNLASSLASQRPTFAQPREVTATSGSGGQALQALTPQIQHMTTLQQQSNNLAFERWDMEQKERARRYAAIGSVVPGLSGAPFRSSSSGYGFTSTDPSEQFAKIFGAVAGVPGAGAGAGAANAGSAPIT